MKRHFLHDPDGRWAVANDSHGTPEHPKPKQEVKHSDKAKQRSDGQGKPPASGIFPELVSVDEGPRGQVVSDQPEGLHVHDDPALRGDFCPAHGTSTPTPERTSSPAGSRGKGRRSTTSRQSRGRSAAAGGS